MRGIVGAVIAVVTVSGCVAPGVAGSTPPAADTSTPVPRASVAPSITPVPPSVGDLGFDAFAATQPGRISVALTPVGSRAAPVVFGDLGSPVAWSTAKVPVAIAVERTPGGAGLRPTMRRAIGASDNEAAEELWRALGDPAQAAAASDAVLRDYGDSETRTQAERTRPTYTAFGQTHWSLADQARFAAQLPCRAEAEPVYAAMGQVIAGQRWGLGRLPGSHYKGGWGPGASTYLVRQFGVITTPRGRTAVALAVETTSLEQGGATLSEVAQWLLHNTDRLPAGQC